MTIPLDKVTRVAEEATIALFHWAVLWQNWNIAYAAAYQRHGNKYNADNNITLTFHNILSNRHQNGQSGLRFFLYGSASRCCCR